MLVVDQSDSRPLLRGAGKVLARLGKMHTGLAPGQSLRANRDRSHQHRVPGLAAKPLIEQADHRRVGVSSIRHVRSGSLAAPFKFPSEGRLADTVGNTNSSRAVPPTKTLDYLSLRLPQHEKPDDG
jgi:hypothetical protein